MKFVRIEPTQPCAPLVVVPLTMSSSDITIHDSGNIPIIISVPHGGYNAVPGVLVRKSGCLEPDFFTQELAADIMKAFSETSYVPFMVIGKIERKYCDLNRPASTAYEDERVASYHLAYHSTISKFIKEVKVMSSNKHNGMCLLIDLHGQSAMKDKNLRGTRNAVTVTHMVQKFGKESLVGNNSIFGYLNSNGFSVFPDTFDEKEHPEYNGGFTVGNYGSKDFKDKELWIDAIQIETGIDFRNDQASRTKFAIGLRDAIVTFYQHHISTEK